MTAEAATRDAERLAGRYAAEFLRLSAAVERLRSDRPAAEPGTAVPEPPP